jgi:hypothetical protein
MEKSQLKMDSGIIYEKRKPSTGFWIAVLAFILVLVLLFLVILLYVERDKVKALGFPLIPKVGTAVSEDVFNTQLYNVYISSMSITGTPLTPIESGDLRFPGENPAATAFTLQISKSSLNRPGRVVYIHNRSPPLRGDFNTIFPPTSLIHGSNVYIRVVPQSSDMIIPQPLLVEPGGSVSLIATGNNQFDILSYGSHPSLPHNNAPSLLPTILGVSGGVAGMMGSTGGTGGGGITTTAAGFAFGGGPGTPWRDPLPPPSSFCPPP